LISFLALYRGGDLMFPIDFPYEEPMPEPPDGVIEEEGVYPSYEFPF
jgi:hypothetical protein